MNKKYFECNIPDTAPGYIHPSKKTEFTTLLRNIKNRMAKLNDALEMTGLPGEQFSRLAKVMFDSFPARFEQCSAEELAAWVHDSNDGVVPPSRLEWPNAEVVVDCRFVTTPEWEMLRHLGMGGSDAASALGTSHYRNQQELYHDKVFTPELISRDESDAIFERGHILEDRVVDAFLKLTGFTRIPESRMFRSRKHPHITADIDAIVKSPDGRIYVFEAKSTKAENYEAWRGNKIPVSYVPQTRQYPAVLDDDRVQGTYIGCLFVVDLVVGGLFAGSAFDGKEFVARSVPRDKAAEERQMEEMEEFWASYVEPGIEPPPSCIPAEDINILKRYHVGQADKSIPVLDLSDEYPLFEGALEEYERLSQEVSSRDKITKGIKAQRDLAAKVFMDRMQKATEARIDIPGTDEYIQIDWSPRRKTAVDLEKLSVAFPDAFAACTEELPEGGGRPFSLKRKKQRNK